jgi:hypothetical protein
VIRARCARPFQPPQVGFIMHRQDLVVGGFAERERLALLEQTG